MCTALIMSGGRSERMRSTNGTAHKALVSVLGVPMLERNLRALLAHGFCDIIVAVNSQEDEVQDYALRRSTQLSAMGAASLRLFVEEFPLGTIGAAGSLPCGPEPLLVVNVDNLSALDLRAFVDFHVETRAALSIATHIEPFQIPFGEVVVQDGFVTEYREKSTLRAQISSGTYVLSQRARKLVPKDCRTDIPSLFATLRERGERIVSFAHNAPWIDVNDAASVERAAQLIQQNARQFDPLL